MDANIDIISKIDLEDLNQPELQVGDIVNGVVSRNFKDFSFVKVGYISCILPLSEISFDKNPKALKVGTEVESVVVKLSEVDGVMVSIKRLAHNPWDNIDSKYKVGQRINVLVKNVTEYGAFVELEQNLTGLIHRKELSWQRKFEMSEVITVGQSVDAEIVSINKERKRIELSIKRCKEDPWTHVGERLFVGQKFVRKVVNIPDFGAFLELEPGVEALLHRTEMGLTKSDKVKNYISVGDEIEVEIATLDIENRKISLKCSAFPVINNDKVTVDNE